MVSPAGTPGGCPVKSMAPGHRLTRQKVGGTELRGAAKFGEESKREANNVRLSKTKLPRERARRFDLDQMATIISATSASECWHDVTREPAELFLEFRGRQTFGPVNHEVLHARVFGLDRLDAVDHLLRRAAEPGFLLDTIA